MPDWIIGFAGTVAPWVAAFVAGIAGWLLAERRGAARERDRQSAQRAQANLENREVRDAVDRDIARDPDPVERLQRSRWRRD